MKENKSEILSTILAFSTATMLKLFDAVSLKESISLFIVSTSLTLMLVQHFKNKKLKSALSEFSSFGILEINQPHTEMDLKKQLSKCKESFVFWGVSARTIINQDGSNLIKSKYFINPNVVFKFLLLDPREDRIGRQRAKEETGNENVWKSWQNIIFGSIEELAALKNEIPNLNIEVRIYQVRPVFRMLEIDQSSIYLNFYCSNTVPTEIPNLHLSKTPYSFYYAIEKSFQNVWDESEVVLSDKGYKIIL